MDLFDGASSANIRPIAWFELNRVSDPSGDKIQYLVAGARGPEGQPCDFTTLRVYTWNLKKERYETAFIENEGPLPAVSYQLCELPPEPAETGSGVNRQSALFLGGDRSQRGSHGKRGRPQVDFEQVK